MKLTDDMLYEAAPEAESIIMKTLPSEEECKVEFSEDFEKRVYRLVKRQYGSSGRKWYRRIAAAAAMCILLYVVGISPVSATLYERFIRFTTIRIGENTETEKVVLKQVSFGYLPEGMKTAEPFEMENDMYVYYPYDEKGNDLQLIQTISDLDEYEEKFIYEGEMEAQNIDGIMYVVVSEADNVSVTWVRYGYHFHLSGNLDKDEILKIAQNIYIAD